MRYVACSECSAMLVIVVAVLASYPDGLNSCRDLPVMCLIWEPSGLVQTMHTDPDDWHLLI